MGKVASADRLGSALVHADYVRRAFDPGAEYWRGYYSRDPEARERLQAFTEALDSVHARGAWLDAGCGIGVMARQLRRPDLRIWGVDASPDLLGRASAVTGLPISTEARAPLEEHLYLGPVEQLPYEDETFEGVYSSSVLEYVASLDLALAEFRRVVRMDGHLIFSMPNAFSVFRIAQALRGRPDGYFRLVPRWAYWRWELRAALARTGWRTVSSRYFGGNRRLRRHLAAAPFAAMFTLVVARKR